MQQDLTVTPLMRQYFEIKQDFTDALLFFQVGDFFELFFEDAKKACSILGIVLTKRGTTLNGDPIPLAGIPVHSLEHYVGKLIKAGCKVAICEQTEIPTPGKIVNRKVTQVLTAGTLTDSKLLDAKSPSYFCTIGQSENEISLIFAELLTGHVFATVIDNNLKNLETELSRFLPDEIVITPLSAQINLLEQKLRQIGFNVIVDKFSILNQNFSESSTWFENQFGQNLYNIAWNSISLKSAIMLLYAYLKRNQAHALFELKNFQIYQSNDYLIIDAASQRNLELVKNNQDGSRTNTLFSVLDFAATPMGSRLLKKWILRPLIKKELIEQRLDIVELFITNIEFKNHLEEILKEIQDIERVVGRIALRRASLRDYLALNNCLKLLPKLCSLLANQNNILIKSFLQKIADFTPLNNYLFSALNDNLEIDILIKPGFNDQLDKLRELVHNTAQLIADLEAREQQKTGISSLRVNYNHVHGYSIEVTKVNMHLVPNHYIRLQTLAAKERYTTLELKELENEIVKAKAEITQVEKQVFESVKMEIEKYLSDLKKLSYVLCNLDAFISLSNAAYNYNYKRPKFNDGRQIKIINGKHPVVAAKLEHEFIPNSANLCDEESFWIITGPNMGGKSTYLRQVALIILMAQIGSFVPATSADLFVVDKIFTRIGAGDNLADGKSTFLIEMEETALICNQATKNSLVILDEVGRGTSTYDGIAIAQAVAEYIFQNIGSRCLFATHYHELTQLTQFFKGIVAYHAASTKTENGIILLHKIEKGVAEGSFGIEVAKVAGLPEKLISRAQEILSGFNKQNY
ncbi:DNA mismatch repair protein MutS [Candidatus Dependentiae bacterium]|nr:DNA mismatch repair protein MutS [Candidatus Dependentiae bacterium]